MTALLENPDLQPRFHPPGYPKSGPCRGQCSFRNAPRGELFGSWSRHVCVCLMHGTKRPGQVPRRETTAISLPLVSMQPTQPSPAKGQLVRTRASATLPALPDVGCGVLTSMYRSGASERHRHIIHPRPVQVIEIAPRPLRLQSSRKTISTTIPETSIHLILKPRYPLFHRLVLTKTIMAIPRASSGMLRSHIRPAAARSAPPRLRAAQQQVRRQSEDLGGPGESRERPPNPPGGPEGVRRNWYASPPSVHA